MSGRILIIGGTGFIGRALVNELLIEGYQLTLLNRGNHPIEGTKQLTADRRKPDQIQKASSLCGNFDIVIDTMSSHRMDTEIAWQAFSGKAGHWIHISTAAVYSQILNGRFPRENDEIGHSKYWGRYGQEKAEADLFLLAQSHCCPVTILRPTYIYGPGNNHDREALIWSHALQDKPIYIPGNGEALVQFLHVGDFASAISRSLSLKPKRSAVYNVGGETVTLKEWTCMATEIVGGNSANLVKLRGNSPVPRSHFPFPNYPCAVDSRHIKEELNWRPQYSLENGLRQTFNSYRKETFEKRDLKTSPWEIAKRYGTALAYRAGLSLHF